MKKIANILRDVPDQSKLTHQEVAELLNAHGLRTGHGETWNKSRVRNPLGRAREVLDAEHRADRRRMEEDEDFGLF